jgi:glycine oxidase
LSTQKDILIIGGGIIGTTLAYRLAKSGRGVTLLEAKPQLAHDGTASWASAGIISPPARMQSPPWLLALVKRSLTLYPALIAELPENSTGYREVGQLSLAANPAEVRGLQKRLRWQEEQGFAASWLMPEEVDEREPLAGQHAGGLYNPAAVVDVFRLTRTLGQAAEYAGAIVRLNSPVAGFLRQNKAVTGVKLATGEEIRAAKTVVAAGAWSGTLLAEQLETPDFRQKVFPVRGQMIAVQPPGVVLKHVLVGGHGYAIPQLDGLVSYGATVEPDAEFENFMTPAGLQELGRLVHKLTPRLETAPVVRSWSGLRPGSIDDLPLIGAAENTPGLWLATGHSRNGVLLAPATAELLAEMMI